MQFWTGISWNTQSESYKLSLTECAWEFQNIALWDTLQHALFVSLALSPSVIDWADMFIILQEEVSEFPGPKTKSKSGG